MMARYDVVRSERVRKKRKKLILDVSREFLDPSAKRNATIELFEEVHIGRFLRTLSGTRDAAALMVIYYSNGFAKS